MHENKAFDNIEFGITKDQFDSLREIKYEIGGYTFYTDGKFTDEGLLHTFILMSLPVDDSEPERVIALKSAIDLKYGQGESISGTSENGFIFLHKWISGRKEIRIGIEVDKDGTENILCWISNKDLIFENAMEKEYKKLKQAENDKELF